MKEVITIELAKEQVSEFVDRKKRLPSKRESLQQMVDIVAEAVQYGFVVIDGSSIKQTFMEPVLNTDGRPSLTGLTFNRPLASAVQVEKAKLKMGANFAQELLCITIAATGESKAMIDKIDT